MLTNLVGKRRKITTSTSMAANLQAKKKIQMQNNEKSDEVAISLSQADTREEEHDRRAFISLL
jgi:hypothetical protein